MFISKKSAHRGSKRSPGNKCKSERQTAQRQLSEAEAALSQQGETMPEAELPRLFFTSASAFLALSWFDGNGIT